MNAPATAVVTASGTAKRPAQTRLVALDWMRGLVMVLMAVDHSSGEFNKEALDARRRIPLAPGHRRFLPRSFSRDG